MALNMSDLKPGNEHSEVVIDNLSRTQLVMYSGASGDYNPLHTDEVYTKEVAETKSNQINNFAKQNEHPLVSDIEPIDEED